VAPASASPTTVASPSASASSSAAAAGCMPFATRRLLTMILNKRGWLTQAQRDEIVAALKAYDFPDTAGQQWRDTAVDAIATGQFSSVPIMQVVSGTVA